MAMTGILGTKLGMTQVFDETGQVVPVTVVQAGPCVVTAVRTPDNDCYSAVQIGFGQLSDSKLRKLTKPVRGQFEKAGVTPRRAGSSRACGWPAGWAPSGRPCRA